MDNDCLLEIEKLFYWSLTLFFLIYEYIICLFRLVSQQLEPYFSSITVGNYLDFYKYHPMSSLKVLSPIDTQ